MALLWCSIAQLTSWYLCDRSTLWRNHCKDQWSYSCQGWYRELSWPNLLYCRILRSDQWKCRHNVVLTSSAAHNIDQSRAPESSCLMDRVRPTLELCFCRPRRHKGTILARLMRPSGLGQMQVLVSDLRRWILWVQEYCYGYFLAIEATQILAKT